VLPVTGKRTGRRGGRTGQKSTGNALSRENPRWLIPKTLRGPEEKKNPQSAKVGVGRSELCGLVADRRLYQRIRIGWWGVRQERWQGWSTLKHLHWRAQLLNWLPRLAFCGLPATGGGSAPAHLGVILRTSSWGVCCGHAHHIGRKRVGFRAVRTWGYVTSSHRQSTRGSIL